MTRDQAIKMILNRCGQRANDKVLQQACVDEMALVQATILEQADFKPWFLLSELHLTLTNLNENRLPLPPGFLEEHDEGTVWTRDPSDAAAPWIPCAKEDYDDLIINFETVFQQPQYYAIVNGYITLFPVPEKFYQVRMRFYSAQALILEPYAAPGPVTTNAWLTYAPDWLIGETGRIIAGQYTKNPQDEQYFGAQAEAARKRVYNQTIARDEANRSREIGDE